MTDNDIYDPVYVVSLFDEMSATYNVVNTVSSFGFCHLWRRQCVAQVDIESDDCVADLMAGMGEMIRPVDRRLGRDGSVVAVDFSSQMCRHAQRNCSQWQCDVTILQADALAAGIPDQSVDVIVSCFGLKTLSDLQLQILAKEVHRMLRPGGRFSFLEISVPRWRLLRALYMFYLHRVIPRIGQLLLGNPDNYRMLGVYTEAFGSCARVADHFRSAGLDTEFTHYFHHCATGVVGHRNE